MSYPANINLIEKAITDLQHGKPIVISDDANRENEADLIIAVKMINMLIMAMLIRHYNGIVCPCIENNLAKKLVLSPMVEKNKASTTPALLFQSNIITGVFAQDRVTTIKAAISPTYKSADVISPGHAFPLVAHPDGLSS